MQLPGALWQHEAAGTTYAQTSTLGLWNRRGCCPAGAVQEAQSQSPNAHSRSCKRSGAFLWPLGGKNAATLAAVLKVRRVASRRPILEQAHLQIMVTSQPCYLHSRRLGFLAASHNVLLTARCRPDSPITAAPELLELVMSKKTVANQMESAVRRPRCSNAVYFAPELLVLFPGESADAEDQARRDARMNVWCAAIDAWAYGCLFIRVMTMTRLYADADLPMNDPNPAAHLLSSVALGDKSPTDGINKSTSIHADVLQFVRKCTAIVPRQRPNMAKVESNALQICGRLDASRNTRRSARDRPVALPTASRLPQPGAHVMSSTPEDKAMTEADDVQFDISMDRSTRALRLSMMRLSASAGLERLSRFSALGAEIDAGRATQVRTTRAHQFVTKLSSPAEERRSSRQSTPGVEGRPSQRRSTTELWRPNGGEVLQADRHPSERRSMTEPWRADVGEALQADHQPSQRRSISVVWRADALGALQTDHRPSQRRSTTELWRSSPEKGLQPVHKERTMESRQSKVKELDHPAAILGDGTALTSTPC